MNQKPRQIWRLVDLTDQIIHTTVPLYVNKEKSVVRFYTKALSYGVPPSLFKLLQFEKFLNYWEYIPHSITRYLSNIHYILNFNIIYKTSNNFHKNLIKNVFNYIYFFHSFQIILHYMRIVHNLSGVEFWIAATEEKVYEVWIN